MSRLASFALLVTWLTGCYAPHFASPGFACNPDDATGCPSGQVCVSGRCADSSATSIPDLATQPSSFDAAVSSTTDLSSSNDFSQQPDLAVAACQPTGGDCTYHQDKVCCSSYCIYSTNKCK